MLLKLNFSYFKFRKIVWRIALSLIFLLTIAVVTFFGTLSIAPQTVSPSLSHFPLGQPSTRIFSIGDIEFASVNLDGFSLFQVASQDFSPSESEPGSSLSPIERRVRRIETTLYNLVNSHFDPQTLEVRPSILNNLTVIVASDQQNLAQQIILTVTEIDAQIAPSSIDELAQQWSRIIQKALIQAWENRQPEARKRQILTAIGISLAMAVIKIGRASCRERV